MKVFSVFFTFYYVFGVQGNQNLLEKSELIKSLANYLNCKTVILITDNYDESIELGKIINDFPELYVGLWSFQIFNKYMFLEKKWIPTKALVVVEYNSVNLQKLSFISRLMSISPLHWLISSAPTSRETWKINKILVPINCVFIISTTKINNTFKLYEAHKLSRHSPTVIKSFGEWKVDNRSHEWSGDIFNKRMDFKGHEFYFAVHNISNNINPCTSVGVDNGKQMVQCAYYKIWNTLGRLFNFTTSYVVIEDCYRNGTAGLSTPMLEMVRSGGADSGEDGYIMSPSRLEHNSFLWPLFQTKVIFVTKFPTRTFSFSSYLRPFSGNMWFYLIICLIFSGIVIHLTKYIAIKIIHGDNISTPDNLFENLFAPFTAICYQSSTSFPKEAAIRLTYLVIYLLPVVFIPSYSGSIISSLSVPDDYMPFNTIKEFEEDGTYQLSAVNNTFFQIFLMTDDQFESIRQKNLMSKAFTVSYEQGFRDICSRKVTFILEWPLLSKYSIQCSVYKFDLSAAKIFSSMAVRKDFPYLELFNRQLQKLISAGLNRKLLEKNSMNYFKFEVKAFPQNHSQIKPFGCRDVLPLFAVLFSGFLVSLFILFLEIKIKRMKTKNKLSSF